MPQGRKDFPAGVESSSNRSGYVPRALRDRWEQRPLDWAMDRIAHLVKDTRDRDFIETSPDGMEVNHLKTIAHLDGATLDNEENCLIKQLLTGGLGILAVENQVRI